jgi:hypothetical protein
VHALVTEKLIRSGRSEIVVLNRKGLERRAGESYGVPEAEVRRLLGWQPAMRTRSNSHQFCRASLGARGIVVLGAGHARNIGLPDLGLVFLATVWAMEPHRLQPDARQTRAIRFKREFNRQTGFRASGNQIAH